MNKKKKGFAKRSVTLVMAITLAIGLIQNPALVLKTQAAPVTKNVVAGITPTVGWLDGSEMQYGKDSETDLDSAARATDGDAQGMDVFFRYGELKGKPEDERKASYAQFDLKKSYDISSVKMWRYWDGRRYTPTAIVVSDTEDNWDAENVKIIYNSDSDGSVFNLGKGTDEGYPETKDGHEFRCDQPVTGRFVRIYSYGSDVNSGNHLVEFQVYASVDEEETETELKNLALNKKVVVRKTKDDSQADFNATRPEKMAVDGIIPEGSCDLNYCDFGLDTQDPSKEYSAYLQVNLKATYELSQINMYRYWNDGRTYEGTVIALAKSEEDFKNGNCKIVYNSDKEDFHGFGSGSDATYNETRAGYSINLKEKYPDEKIEAHYIRVYMHGSDKGSTNHIVELQAMGYDRGQKPDVNVIIPQSEDYEVEPAEGSSSPMEPGSNYSFKVNVKEGYYVAEVKANGTVLEAKDGIYVIENIQDDQKLEVTVLRYPDMENLALKKKVVVRKTEDDSQAEVSPERTEKMAVDGIIPTEDWSDANYCDFGTYENEYSSYLQVDLKSNCELTDINMWRYWTDGRTYDGTVIAVAKSEEDFKKGNCKILYNSDEENYHGFGSGKDNRYVETKNGYTISLKDRFPDEKIQARFVRVYMHGSVNGGKSNHIVELQVMGYDFGTKPYKAKAFDNTGNYTELPTHYNENYPEDPNSSLEKHLPGQVTHPDVVKVEEGFGGHKYWMLYTPNVMLTSQFENPYIVYSDDGITWKEPIGDNGKTVNPIGVRTTGPTEGYAHNNDTDVVYDAENKRLLAYWNWSMDTGVADCQVRMKVSYDGIHWGAPVEGKEAEKEIKEDEFVTVLRDQETKYNYISPSITYDSYRDMYFMYYNNAGNVGYYNGHNNKVQIRYSKDGINWSKEVRDTVNFLDKDQYGDQLSPWHQDVQYIPEKNEYWALSQCFTGSSPDNSVLYMTKSKDGLNWKQVGTQPVLEPNEAPFWNDFQIYRSTFHYNADDNTMDLWYSALQTTPGDRKVADSNGELTLTAGTDDSRIWRIGHTSNNMKEVMKALTQDEFYEEPGDVKSQGFMLTAEKPVLKAGDVTKTTQKWSDQSGEAVDTVSDMNVKFTSDNEKVATVDPWGQVTAVSDGIAIISGTTKEGSETEILITVGEQKKVAPRHVVDSEHPLYISNYYWSDGAPTRAIDACDAGQYPEKNYISDEVNEDGTRPDRDDPLKLWNSIPDDLKDNTVVLLISERSIRDDVIEEGTKDVNAVRNWYKKQAEFCNKNKIPFAVQNLNGETNTYNRIPLSFWKQLAEEYEYFVGFNGAELYNRFSGGELNNADEYVADLIRMGATMGVSMMWTDTNVFGNHGVLMDWLEEDNSVLGNAMKDNHEYVTMMYKESYGNPSTDALYLGLWLTGYCDNWGVASDWWHWQLDGNGTMFDKPGNIGGWGQTLVWPENMYSQDIIRVASMGATGYKSEPQWYSVASNGHRTPAYQYSVMPTLQKVCSGEIHIPTREEVASRTKLVVKGFENFRSVIYDSSYSQLYPKTGQYGIVPLVPNTVDNVTLEKLGFTKIVETPLTEKMLQEVYPDAKYEGTAWAENWGDTWYMMNSSEDKDVRQSATVQTKPGEITVDMAPHTYAVVTGQTDYKLDLVLSNYRLDKSELWNGTNPAESMSKVYQYIWEMSRRMENNEGLDKDLRETVITVNTKEKPIVSFKNEGDNEYAYDNYTRPFTHSEVTGEANNWQIKIQHNGFVECSISTGKDAEVNKTELKELIDKADKLNPDEYTKESFEAMKEELKKAQEVFDDKKATQDDVDDAVKALQKSITDLVKAEEPEEPKVDKTELKELIDKADKLSPDEYTKESYKAMKDELKKAQEVYDDKKATQDDVDDVVKALQKAIDQLKNVPTNPDGSNDKPGENPSDKPSDKPGNSADSNQTTGGNEIGSGNKGDVSETPETGDNANIFFPTLGLLVAFAVIGGKVVLTIRRKHR